jgi:hypothetical protein
MAPTLRVAAIVLSKSHNTTLASSILKTLLQVLHSKKKYLAAAVSRRDH